MKMKVPHKWRIVHTSEETSDELVSLFEREEVKREIALLLKLLTQEDDPRRPTNYRILNVAAIQHHAPGWFRLKVARFNIRIIFQLLYVKDDELIEYRTDEVPLPDAENYIDIVQAGYRNDDTYLEARQRWKRRHRND